MTRNDVTKLIYVIKNTWPKVYEHFSRDDWSGMIDAWAMVFDEYSYFQASRGLAAYMKSENRGFPPSPGQIIDKIHRMSGTGHPNAGAAWSMVRKALSRSGYYSEEEFAKLPPEVQEAVGSAGQLYRMACDENFNEDVESSNFKRIYANVLARHEEDEKIPPKLKEELVMARPSWIEDVKPLAIPQEKHEEQHSVEKPAGGIPEHLRARVEQMRAGDAS